MGFLMTDNGGNSVGVSGVLVKHIMRQLLLGLAHIHRSAVIHFDIKPDNIFLTASDPPQVKIGDFDVSYNIAERGTTMMRMTSVQGFTPDYVPPELMSPSEHSPSEKCDVYSAGFVLFDMAVSKQSDAFALRASVGEKAGQRRCVPRACLRVW